MQSEKKKKDSRKEYDDRSMKKEKKRILVSGGNSFIARHLIREAVKRNYQVTALVRELPKKENRLDEVTYIILAMDKYGKLADYVASCDFYIPFAWEGTKKADRNDCGKNEKSFECIMESIQVALTKLNCSKIVLPGTFSEYQNLYEPIDENTCCESSLAYGKYKNRLYREAAALCQSCQRDLVEVRMFSVYGADDSPDKMINQTLIKMMKQEKILLTEANQIWDFLHVEDAVAAFFMLMEYNVESGCYNLATPEHRTLRSYLEEMKQLTNSQSRLLYGAIPYETDQLPHVICVVDKIQKAIPWRPQISFAKGVQEMCCYYQRQ